jgi:hypothetical protein
VGRRIVEEGRGDTAIYCIVEAGEKGARQVLNLTIGRKEKDGHRI